MLATTREIPQDCAAAIAVNPRTTYLPAESDVLDAYLARGGAALLLYDLGFVVEPRLASLLDRLGVKLPQEVVVDPLDHYATDHETVAVPVADPHPITARVALTFYPGVRPLTVLPPRPGVVVTPLVRSSKESFSRPVVPAGADVARQPAPVAPRASGDRRGPHVLAAAIEGRWPEMAATAPPFRAVIAGDGDFASNSFLPYMANSDLALSMVRWLVREESATKVRPAIPVPAMVLLSAREMQRIFLAVEVLLPLGVVFVGAVVWWRRR